MEIPVFYCKCYILVLLLLSNAIKLGHAVLSSTQPLLNTKCHTKN